MLSLSLSIYLYRSHSPVIYLSFVFLFFFVSRLYLSLPNALVFALFARLGSVFCMCVVRVYWRYHRFQQLLCESEFAVDLKLLSLLLGAKTMFFSFLFRFCFLSPVFLFFRCCCRFFGSYTLNLAFTVPFGVHNFIRIYKIYMIRVHAYILFRNRPIDVYYIDKFLSIFLSVSILFFWLFALCNSFKIHAEIQI